MKTTLNLHDALIEEAKAFAVRQHVSLTRLIEEGLRMRLRAGKTPAKALLRPMPVFDGRSGLSKGLAGLSTRELLDAADSA